MVIVLNALGSLCLWQCLLFRWLHLLLSWLLNSHFRLSGQDFRDASRPQHRQWGQLKNLAISALPPTPPPSAPQTWLPWTLFQPEIQNLDEHHLFQVGNISAEIFRLLQKLGGASARCTHSKLDIESVENLEMCCSLWNAAKKVFKIKMKTSSCRIKTEWHLSGDCLLYLSTM